MWQFHTARLSFSPVTVLSSGRFVCLRVCLLVHLSRSPRDHSVASPSAVPVLQQQVPSLKIKRENLDSDEHNFLQKYK